MAAMTARVMWCCSESTAISYPTRRRIDGVGSQQPSGQPRHPLSEAKMARAIYALTRAAGSLSAVLLSGQATGFTLEA